MQQTWKIKHKMEAAVEKALEDGAWEKTVTKGGKRGNGLKNHRKFDVKRKTAKRKCKNMVTKKEKRRKIFKVKTSGVTMMPLRACYTVTSKYGRVLQTLGEVS